jgi:molecular chaperone HscB
MEFAANHFDLFGLPPRYALDASRLERGYRDLQSRVHPDRFAASPEAERRVAMQWAARANEAYRTLRDPIGRARYLLSLKGYDTGEETNTAMPPDFLMQQMEWREAVAQAREASDAPELRSLAPTSRSRAPGCWACSSARSTRTRTTTPAARW